MRSAAENVSRMDIGPVETFCDKPQGRARVVALQRSTGAARIAFKARDGRTVLDDVHQSGCCKVRFPRPDPGATTEAVLINTAGGLTDADRLTVEARWRPGTCAVVTSQAAERVYRSRDLPARVASEPSDSAVDFANDSKLDSRVTPIGPPTRIMHNSQILLTGATGFLGAQVLSEFIRQTDHASTQVAQLLQ